MRQAETENGEQVDRKNMQKADPQPIEIVQLPVEEWQIYRQIRLEALRDAPQAFGSTYQEQSVKPDAYWQSRLEEAAKGENRWLLFAHTGAQPIGMIGDPSLNQRQTRPMGQRPRSSLCM